MALQFLDIFFPWFSISLAKAGWENILPVQHTWSKKKKDAEGGNFSQSWLEQDGSYLNSPGFLIET